MTKNEVKKILAIMATTYPDKLVGDITQEKLNIWHEMLQDLQSSDVAIALKKWISTEKYPPAISDIRNAIATAQTSEKITAEEAWGLIQELVRKHGGYNKELALSLMPETIRKIVNRFDWRYFCEMPVDETGMYFAQFRNAYNSECQKEKERLQIPQDVQDKLKLMTDNKGILVIPNNVANFEQREYTDEYHKSMETDVLKYLEKNVE